MITCGSRNIFVDVEGYLPHCCSCGAASHLAKLGPGRNPAPEPQPAISEQPKEDASRKALSGLGVWTEVIRRGETAATPPPQQEVPKILLRDTSGNGNKSR